MRDEAMMMMIALLALMMGMLGGVAGYAACEWERRPREDMQEKVERLEKELHLMKTQMGVADERK